MKDQEWNNELRNIPSLPIIVCLFRVTTNTCYVNGQYMPIWYIMQSLTSHNCLIYPTNRDRRGHDKRQLDLWLPMQSMYVTTMVVISNPTHGEVYSGYPGFPHQYILPPRYNWNTVDITITPNPNSNSKTLVTNSS